MVDSKDIVGYWIVEDTSDKYEDEPIEQKSIEEDIEDLLNFLQWSGEIDNIL